jgi:hypothetical protein
MINGLYFAFRVARLFIEKEGKIGEKEIPIDTIQHKLEDLISKLSTFNSVDTKLTQIDYGLK